MSYYEGATIWKLLFIYILLPREMRLVPKKRNPWAKCEYDNVSPWSYLKPCPKAIFLCLRSTTYRGTGMSNSQSMLKDGKGEELVWESRAEGALLPCVTSTPPPLTPNELGTVLSQQDWRLNSLHVFRTVPWVGISEHVKHLMARNKQLKWIFEIHDIYVNFGSESNLHHPLLLTIQRLMIAWLYVG